MIDAKFRKLAVMASALAGLCVLAAACDGGGDDDDDSFTPELVLKDDGSPANFACNGTFADPASTNSNFTANFRIVEQTISGTPLSANTTIVMYDTLTGTTNGAFTDVTAAGGTASIAGLNEFDRYAWKLRRAGGAHVDTYTFGVLATAGTTTLRIIQDQVAGVFIGLLVSPVPADLRSTTHQIAGAIEDCDGDAIQNAYIEVDGPGGTGIARRCGEDDSVFPCVAYFAGASPSKSAVDSDVSGQFVVVGAPPNAQFVVRVMGVIAAGASPVQIGQVTVNGKAGAISLASTHPLPE